MPNAQTNRNTKTMKTLYTRDLYKRKCELEELKEALEEAREAREEIAACPSSTQDEANRAVQDAEADFGEDEASELEELEELESEISDFMHGAQMIPVDDFEAYAEELAEELGMIDRSTSWPFTCIDWKQAANELAQDYSVVTYQGQDYYVRS